MGLIRGKGQPHYYDSDNCYFCLSDKSGAQVWLFISGNKEILGFTPHFEGDARYPVTVTRIENTEGSMQGGWHCWSNPEAKDKPEEGLFPFLFECPDTLTFVPPIMPWFSSVQLSAFAHELFFWKDEQSFQASFASGGNHPPASVLKMKALDESQPMAQFTARVIKAEERVNNLTKQVFRWARVQTEGGELDLVWHTGLSAEMPQPDSIVQATAWLSGRFVERPRLKGRGLRGLLFGRKS